MYGHLSSTGNGGSCFSREDGHQMVQLVYTLSGTMCVGHGILSQESSPTGSRPCTLGRCQQTEPPKTREGAKKSQRESWFVLKHREAKVRRAGRRCAICAAQQKRHSVGGGEDKVTVTFEPNCSHASRKNKEADKAASSAGEDKLEVI